MSVAPIPNAKKPTISIGDAVQVPVASEHAGATVIGVVKKTIVQDDETLLAVDVGPGFSLDEDARDGNAPSVLEWIKEVDVTPLNYKMAPNAGSPTAGGESSATGDDLADPSRAGRKVSFMTPNHSMTGAEANSAPTASGSDISGQEAPSVSVPSSTNLAANAARGIDAVYCAIWDPVVGLVQCHSVPHTVLFVILTTFLITMHMLQYFAASIPLQSAWWLPLRILYPYTQFAALLRVAIALIFISAPRTHRKYGIGRLVLLGILSFVVASTTVHAIAEQQKLTTAGTTAATADEAETPGALRRVLGPAVEEAREQLLSMIVKHHACIPSVGDSFLMGIGVIALVNMFVGRQA